MTAEKTFRHICVTSPFRRAAKRAGKQFSQLADEIMAAVELLEAGIDPSAASWLRGATTDTA